MGGGIFPPYFSPKTLSFLLYLQTGRFLPSSDTAGQETVVPSTPPAPTLPPQTVPAPASPVFTSADLERLSFHDTVSYEPDLEHLLLAPLDWLEEPPVILIIHTHTTESYTGAPEEVYSEHGAYRSLDPAYNMIAVGEEVARILLAGGVRVIHDKTLHDYPSYNDSYGNARQTVLQHLEAEPGITMVLDIHRDASDGAGGSQLVTTGTVGGQPSSQLMMVVGSDATGNYFPNWQDNLSLALKLTALLEQTDPGLTRPVTLREHRFNMDLTPGSLIVEVGAAGDTHGEALLAANALARAVLTLVGNT
jgi:stage II sporulation protein P